MAPLWHVGDRIQQRWEVHHVQRGSMGLVYVVYDHDTHRPTPPKPYRRALSPAVMPAPSASYRQRKRGSTSTPTSTSRQAHGVEIIDGQPWLFLEYVSGGESE